MASDPEHRFLGVRISIWDGLSGLVAVIGIVAAGAGLIVATYDLAQRRDAARAQATLNLLDTWEDDGYFTAFRSLDARVAGLLEDVPSADIAAARADPAIRARLYERITGSVMQNAQANKEFEDVVYFFQRLTICVESALCDRETTLAFFRGPMQSFARTYAAPIADRRKKQADFADGLLLAEYD